MPTPTKSPKPTKKRTSLVIFFSVLAVIVGVGAYFFVVWDIQARAAFTTVSDEALRIEQVGIKPLENRFVKEVAKGDGLLSRIECIPDVKCPTVQKTWYVVVEDGEEGDVLRSVFEKAGYVVNDDCRQNAITSCIFISRKGDFALSGQLYKSSEYTEQINSATKKWKKLILNIDLNN